MNRPLIIAVVGVVVVAVAIGLNFVVPWSTDTADKVDSDKIRRVTRLVLRMLDGLQADELGA